MGVASYFIALIFSSMLTTFASASVICAQAKHSHIQSHQDPHRRYSYTRLLSYRLCLLIHCRLQLVQATALTLHSLLLLSQLHPHDVVVDFGQIIFDGKDL